MWEAICSLHYTHLRRVDLGKQAASDSGTVTDSVISRVETQQAKLQIENTVDSQVILIETYKKASFTYL